MNKYILDTQTLEWINDPDHIHHEPCISNFSELEDTDKVAVSILTIYELNYSLENLPHSAQSTRERLIDLLEYVCSHFKILNLTLPGSTIFSRLKVQHKSRFGITNKNIVRHNFDLLIASQAIETGSTLVSHDAFFPILSGIDPRLKVVDWTVSSHGPGSAPPPQ